MRQMHFQRAELVETSGWLGRERRNDSVLSLSSLAYWLSGSLIAVAGMAAAGTFLIPGVLRGLPVMNGSARGTALVLFAVALPLLAISMWLTSRGSARGAIACTSALIVGIDVDALRARFAHGTPVRPIAVFMLAIVVLNAAAWLGQILPATFSRAEPAFLDGTGL